ncbi:hypothetical protein [Falsibacillus albus]|uniref:Uncharacterized protein n=1 Tax=Falsibacillus albus TaxID=2478915 RepID=A0A3L7JS18_9BACI|nr:hypothetical protein [Falsibacillus albus]RLQ93648.1 hypothetical protein D9X91_16835 [Falsibacillus albus]
MRGLSMTSDTDFSGHQLEIFFCFSIFFILAIWVYYDTDKYLTGGWRHFYWIATLLTGPIGLVFYLYKRRDMEF